MDTYIYLALHMCTHRPMNANIQIISSPQINYQYEISKKFCVHFSRVTVSMAHMQAHITHTALSMPLHESRPYSGLHPTEDMVLQACLYRFAPLVAPVWANLPLQTVQYMGLIQAQNFLWLWQESDSKRSLRWVLAKGISLKAEVR